MFADDVLFIVEDPINILPKLYDKVSGFGELAEFYINYKNKILCKNMTTLEERKLQKLVGYEVVNNVKYLGIYIMKKILTLSKTITKKYGKL